MRNLIFRGRIRSGQWRNYYCQSNAPAKRCFHKNIEAILIWNETCGHHWWAYVDFGGQSAVTLINDYPNLLLSRLCPNHIHLRIAVGYALGNEELIEGIIRVKDSINSYTVDRLALAGARKQLRWRLFQETRSKIMKSRERYPPDLRKWALQWFLRRQILSYQQWAMPRRNPVPAAERKGYSCPLFQ